MIKNLTELVDRLGIGDIGDLGLIRQALTHRSFSKSHNERLEFLGDAVLELVITELLYREYPDKGEGELTSLRSAIVKTESLAAEAVRLELGNLLFVSKGEELTGGRSRPYILADAFEALIGAMYLISGYEKTKDFIIREVYYKINDIIKNRSDIDAKSRLQEYVQEKFKVTPIYKVLSEEGPDHDKTFTVVVVIANKEYEQGTGKSKQLAEQEAAKKTLSKMNLI